MPEPKYTPEQVEQIRAQMIATLSESKRLNLIELAKPASRKIFVIECEGLYLLYVTEQLCASRFVGARHASCFLFRAIADRHAEKVRNGNGVRGRVVTLENALAAETSGIIASLRTLGVDTTAVQS